MEVWSRIWGRTVILKKGEFFEDSFSVGSMVQGEGGVEWVVVPFNIE